MNTKTFAQQSRALLMEGVANKLLYWGFKADGSTSEEPNPVAGGYTFRGKVFDDETVPKLWESLQQAIKNKGIDVVKEEAAYTWFNRMMALQIVAKNEYQDDQLAYVTGMANTPQILQKARQGQYSFLNTKEQERLKRIITDFSKEQEAFALLLVGYCHNNKMLNNVFGRLDDYTELLLPDNMLQDSGFLHLLNTTDAISDDQYKEVELIGWLYQFYISERKDEVFASFKKKKKAEAKDIPAATQIFTPNWIVKYMVQNTVGKIWLDKNPNSKIKSSLKYLVENESDSTSETTISDVSQLTLIDPAAGSGHILVEGFDLIYQMYMEEYYTPEEAVETIFKNNLFGLDIDDRAAQLATFAILLKAAKQYRDVFAKGWLPNVFSFPENKIDDYFIKETVNVSELKNSYLGFEIAEAVIANETLVFADDDTGEVVSIKKEANLIKKGTILSEKEFEILIKNKISQIEIFPYRSIKDFLATEDSDIILEIAKGLSELRNGKNLGSTLKVTLSNKARTQLTKQYSAIKELDKNGALDIHQIGIWHDLQRYIDVLLILSKKYTSVVANPPYMGSGNMNDGLKNYLNANYPISKSDLFAVFIESMIEMLQSNGRLGCITMESWMFLSSYEQLRKKIIETYSIASLAHFGWHIIGIAFGTATLILEKSKRIKFGEYSYLTINDINRDTNIPYQFPKKDNGRFAKVAPSNFSKMPGSPIAYWANDKTISIFTKNSKLGAEGTIITGMTTGKNIIFLKNWFEINYSLISLDYSEISEYNPNKKWIPYSKGGNFRKWYGNYCELVNWERKDEFNRSKTTLKNLYFREGITWSFITAGSFNARYLPKGFLWDVAGSPCFFEAINMNEIVLGYTNSRVAQYFLNMYNPTMNYQAIDVQNLPWINSDYNFVVEKVKENLAISKTDWDSKEISWNFKESPLINGLESIKKAFEKMYEIITHNFLQLHFNEEELNRIFINKYSLEDELTPEVALKDITILQDELKKNDLDALEEKFRANGKDAIILPIDRGEVISQFISYAIGLFMGRYRLDKPGLNIAHPNPTKEELANYSYNHGEVIIDQDAILPIMGKNCNFNDDVVKQLTQLLDTIWGHEQRTENINFIQECLDKELEKFLVNDFWSYHCGMYKKTPIYWLFSSKKGAFQVLVYMHRMNEFTVEKIRANYLLEHLKYLKSEITQKEANASSLSTVEAKQLDKLRADLIECEQYDMALKNVADQQIKFDLDDGVAKNFELFETVVVKIK